MGRKTWESIPPKFRPLKDRTNVVITRSKPNSTSECASVVVNSLESAIKTLDTTGTVGKAFIIGGAEIYKAALKMEESKRILLTRVLSDFESDTVFPVVLGEDTDSGAWEKKSKEELDSWTGEVVPEGVQEENGTRYVFEMWERKE